MLNNPLDIGFWDLEFHLLRGQGFEPQSTVPETVVLPLDDPRIACMDYIRTRDSISNYQ